MKPPKIYICETKPFETLGGIELVTPERQKKYAHKKPPIRIITSRTDGSSNTATSGFSCFHNLWYNRGGCGLAGLVLVHTHAVQGGISAVESHMCEE